MITYRLNTFFLKWFVGLGVFLAMMHCHHFLWAAITPERDVIIIDNPDKSANPSWKTIWDEARRLSREGQFLLAASKYNKLLTLKPNIEEAKWEYCKVLVELKKWSDASMILESLLEIDPARNEYLLMAGTVSRNIKQYQQGVEYFAQVFHQEPFKPVAVQALEGLVGCLRELGKDREAFPLLLQLNLRQPNDKNVLVQLARTAKNIGRLGQAVSYYSTLVTKFTLDDRDLLDASSLSEHLGLEEKALTFQSKYLKRHPNYLPYQKKVADYYLKKGKNHLALSHLEILSTHQKDRADLLLLISKIYLKDEGRPDKALFYLEKYKKRHPDDKEVAEQIQKTRGVLANDLLSIVQNDGAAMLWRDLKKITPDRQAIFETMANLLDKKKNEKKLYEVLEIIHKHNPRDKKISWQLAKVAYKRKEYTVSYKNLKLIAKTGSEIPGYFILRAKVEEILGYQNAALSTYLKSLHVNPNQFGIRKRAMILAGEFGRINDLRLLYLGSHQGGFGIKKKYELEDIYVDGLIKSRMYSDVENFYTALSRRLPKDDKHLLDLKLKLATVYFEEGRIFEAEQIAREILAQNVFVDKALEALTRMSFKSGDTKSGKAWLYLLSKRTGVDLLSTNYVDWPEEEFYQKVELFVAERKYHIAIWILKHYLKQLETKPATEKKRQQHHRADLMLCRLLYKSKQYDKAEDRIQLLLGKNPDEVELLVIINNIRKDQISGKRESERKIFTFEKSKSLSILLAAAKFEYQYGEFKKAENTIRLFLNKIPASTTGRILKGKIFIAQKKFDQALKIFHNLSQEFEKESYFQRQVLELEFKCSNFDYLAKTIASEQKTTAMPTKTAKTSSEVPDFWKGILLARTLWAQGHLEESIEHYKSLLVTPVEKIFLRKIKTSKVDLNLPPLERSIWDVVTFRNEKNEDPLGTVMEPLFVGAHIGKPIDTISAELYDDYRWQLMIRKELSAKQAVQKRNYHQAEKEYRALMKKGDSDESIYDLAKVYNRLELYGKEGELYQTLKEKGTEYPELDALVRRNTLKRMPRISYDYLYVNQKGRDGYFDVKKKTSGFDGWRMPAFDQELNVRVERSYAISSDRSQKIWMNRLYGTYTINFYDDNDLLINLGGNFVESQTNFIYKLEWKGRLNDSTSADIFVSQDAVEDTVPVIREGIYYRDFSTGLRFDPFPRFFFGGDYRYRDYQDNNYQNRFHFWSSYDLFGETSLLQLKYDYDQIQSSRANLGREFTSSTRDYSTGDVPYWSPDLYWRHLITIRYKHTMDAEPVSSAWTSYYTLDYSFGYETESELVDCLGFNIFLEINRHFLLKGNFKYYSAGDYILNTGMLSLIYRW